MSDISNTELRRLDLTLLLVFLGLLRRRKATLVAADGPLATISDDRGQFGFSSVPPGAYRLLVTFEGRTVEQAVTVVGPRTEVRVAP